MKAPEERIRHRLMLIRPCRIRTESGTASGIKYWSAAKAAVRKGSKKVLSIRKTAGVSIMAPAAVSKDAAGDDLRGIYTSSAGAARQNEAQKPA